MRLSVLFTAFVIVTAAAQAQERKPHQTKDIEADDLYLLGANTALNCASCHGITGVSDNPTFPILAGQHAPYLAEALHSFRSGKRYSALMTPIAQQLTDKEIDGLAIYFSRQDRTVAEDEISRRRNYR